MKNDYILCPICGGTCSLLDVVDFNKSCEEPKGKFLSLSGVPVYYTLCSECGFCFAPEICGWSFDEFAEKIYNDQYADVDPDYVEVRPRINVATLLSAFGGHADALRHIDYGGGNGVLARSLCEANWRSTSYDPFAERAFKPEELGKFNLITAFEVFEHAPNIPELISQLRALLASPG